MKQKKKIKDIMNDPKSRKAPATYELWALLYDRVGELGNVVQILAETTLKYLKNTSHEEIIAQKERGDIDYEQGTDHP